MKKNMGFLDVTIRLVIAALIVGLYMGDLINGMLAVVLLVLAAAFLLTSSLGFCPLYVPFGISTRKKSNT